MIQQQMYLQLYGNCTNVKNRPLEKYCLQGANVTLPLKMPVVILSQKIQCLTEPEKVFRSGVLSLYLYKSLLQSKYLINKIIDHRLNMAAL